MDYHKEFLADMHGSYVGKWVVVSIDMMQLTLEIIGNSQIYITSSKLESILKKAEGVEDLNSIYRQ